MDDHTKPSAAAHRSHARWSALGRAAASGWSKATLGAVLAALAGVAVAGAQSAGVAAVHACVTNSSGAIRILTDPTGYSNPSQACAAGGAEHVLDFNQAGPAGSQGAAGPAGTLDAATVAAFTGDIDAEGAQIDGLVADLARNKAQASALRRLTQRFSATHVPGYGTMLARLRRLVGPTAAQQLFAPGAPPAPGKPASASKASAAAYSQRR
jgi:hypothetical protein